MILAGDVGATKILLEAGEMRSGRWEAALARRYEVDEFSEISEVLDRFLEEWTARGAARSRKLPRHGLAAAAIGAAGPKLGNRIKLTHRPWIIDGDILARRFGIPSFTLVNDLAAAGHGIDLLGARDFLTLQPGRAVPGAPRVVLGIGTGLGVAYLLPKTGDRPRLSPTDKRDLSPVLVVPGEGGHMGFSPASARQAELWQGLFATRGRVEAEEVASGMGLSNIYDFLAGRGDGPAGTATPADPAWISASALERGDATSRAALELFVECLGNIAGEQAVGLVAQGGVYLAGGVIAKIAPSIDKDAFRAAFCAKGAFSSLLMKIPVRAVTNERVMLLGAARVAAEAAR